jgi:nicotinate (nicotinamide) nucleotide adenylyltransferase
MVQVILFYGGSFSPPTNGHINAIQKAARFASEKHPGLTVMGVFVPVSSKYKKASVQFTNSDMHRINMLNILKGWLIAHESSPNIKYDVSAHEIEAESGLPTIDSLEILKDRYGHDNIYYLVLGEDNLKQIIEKKWKRSNDLLRNPIIFLPRPGETSNNINISRYSNISPVPLNVHNMSSTKLRAAIKNKSNNAYTLTIEPIIQYIMDNNLYKNSAGGRRRTRKRRGGLRSPA